MGGRDFVANPWAPSEEAGGEESHLLVGERRVENSRLVATNGKHRIHWLWDFAEQQNAEVDLWGCSTGELMDKTRCTVSPLSPNIYIQFSILITIHFLQKVVERI